MDLIGLPVKSIGLVWGWRRDAAASSGVSRNTRSVFKTPQHMWPSTMNASPPNIFREFSGALQNRPDAAC
jgi:hypothetical protein